MQVLGDPAAQDDIRQRLALRKDFYSVETFMRAIRAQVEWALQARRSADPATRGQHI